MTAPQLSEPAVGGTVEPSPRVRRWVIGGGLGLLAVSCAAAAWLIVLALPGHHDFTASRSMSAGGARLLRINDDSGNVRLSPGTDGRIHANVTGRYTSHQPVVSLTRDGDVSTLTANCPRHDQLSCTVGVTVTVPADLELRVDAPDGEIAAANLTGPLDLHGTNGPVTLTDPAGPLTVNSTNGDIRIVGARSQSLTVQTANGNVQAYFTEPPKSAAVTSTNGGVIVAVPHGTGYAIDARSENGAVRVSSALQNGRSDRTISVHTANGSISVRPATR
jgi:hypothetical protein